MSTKTMMTVEQFLEMPDDWQRRHELIQGELIDREGELTEVPMNILDHNWMRDRLVRRINEFAEVNQLGTAVAEAGIRVDSGTLCCADGAFWDSGHFVQIDRRSVPVTVLPQLIFEVASPSNSFSELLKKARLYQRNGVQTVWVMNDDPFEIHVFEGNKRYVLGPDDQLEAPDLLPGFSIPASDLIPPK